MKVAYCEQLESPDEVDRDVVESSFRKAKLSVKQIKVCRLILYKGLTQTDVAKKIGTSRQAVGKLMCVALSKLNNFRLSNTPKDN